MKKNHLFIALAILLLGTLTIQAQTSIYPIGFYNLENLYHPLSTDEQRDVEFSPEGSKNWTMEKYNKKLNNMAYAISQIAKEQNGLVALGVSEIGNRQVLEDLIKTGDLAKRNLAIVHYDSPDRRGVDVGLIYNPSVFKVTSSYPYPYNLPDNPTFKTRDQLLVSGTLAGEPLHIIVGHWPSRYGSKSSELREFAASISKHISDSIRKADPAAKVIIMGDLNDDPTDISVRVVLNAKKDMKEVEKGGLYNTMWAFFDKGIGTLVYQGRWNLFDQIIISDNLISKDGSSSLKFWKAEIFNKDFLLQKEGKKYKGYPMRTFRGNSFINGYSDHFPTLIYLVKKSK